jgi:hypothetical protein
MQDSQLDVARRRFDVADRAWKRAHQGGDPDPDHTECDAASDALWTAEVADIEDTLRMNLPMVDAVAHAIGRYLIIAARRADYNINNVLLLRRLAAALAVTWVAGVL